MKNTVPMLPSVSATSTAIARFRLSVGTMSGSGTSSQSTSPFCSAAEAVAWSAMITHSIRFEAMRLPPASQEGGFLAWHVVGESLEAGTGAWRPLLLEETHRAAADILGDLLERIGRCDAGRHDEAARRADLAERQQHLRIGFLQRPAEGAVVDGDELVLDGLDHLAHGVACRPAVDAGDGVFR